MLLIIFLIIIVVTGFIIIYMKRKPIEGFVPFEFKSIPSTSMYNKAGIEPCNILDNNTLTSGLYLGSLRFRKEKPGEPDRTQCYYFTDRDPKKTILQEEIPGRNLPPIADPLSAYPCSKTDNPLLQNISFITGTKEINTPDATLQPGISYNRCILDIDKSKATPQEINKFWAPLDVTNSSPQSLPCAAALASLQKETDMYNSKIDQVQGDIASYKNQLGQLMSASNAFRSQSRIANQTPRQVATVAAECESITKTLTNSLVTASNNYTTSINAANREKESSYELINTYQNSIQDLKKDITAIQSQRAPVETTVGYNQSLNQQLNNTFADLSQRNDDCGRKVLEGMQTLTTLRSQQTELRNQRDRLLQERANTQEALKALGSINAQLKTDAVSMADRAQKATEQANTCDRDLKNVTREANYWVEELAKIKAALQACQNALSPYQSQISVLNRKVEQLQGENPELTRNIYDLQAKIQEDTYKFAQIKADADTANTQIANEACQRTSDLNMMAAQIQASLVPFTKPRDKLYLPPSCADVIKTCACPTNPTK